MKRYISFLLVFCMIFSLVSFSGPASATESKLTLSVGTISAQSTQTGNITVPVEIETNEAGFVDFQFTVKYDNTVLEAVSASIPNNSMLIYTPDLSDPETSEKPFFMANASQKDSELRVAMMGVTYTDEQGQPQPHLFTKTGTFINLTFKLLGELKELKSALSTIEISKSDSVFTPLIFHYADGSDIPYDSIICNSGGITFSDCTSPDSITIESKGNINQNGNSITAMSFTAKFESSACYALDATQWYVNDTLQENISGRVFSFTPPGSGEFVITAQNGNTKSNAITVTVSAAATLTPFVPMATPTIPPSSDFEFEVLNKQIVITKYTGTETDVVIPSSIGEYPVCKIGHDAFSGRPDITSITLPEGIDEIMSNAFSGCTALAQITLPKSLYFLQSNAFDGCSSLERVDMLNSFIWISANAFSNTKKLCSIYCYTETPFALEENAFSGTSSALVIYYMPDYAQYWSPNGENTYAGIPIVPFTVGEGGLVPSADSGYTASSGILTGVSAKTTVATLISAFSGGNISVTDALGNVLDIDKTVTTGSKVKLTDGDQVLDELTIAVIGDVNGDGNANSRDIALLQRHLLGTTQFEGIFFMAGDINSDAKLNSRDISGLQKILLG